MKLSQLLKVLFLLYGFIIYCNASKIILITTAGTKSHKIFFNGITETLAERGHQVTVISPFESSPSKTPSKVREILSSTNFIDVVMTNAFQTSITSMISQFMEAGPAACVDCFLEKPVQEVLKENYDLAMVPFGFADCFLPYFTERKIPFIFVYPNSLYGPNSEMIGNLELPSIVPSMLMEATYPMTFIQRMSASLISVFTSVFTFSLYNRRMESETKNRGFYPPHIPSLSTLQSSASLTLINSNRPLECPQRPYSPTVIFAGGIHINPKNEAPKDLQEWMDATGDEGFILFSLGSKAKSSHMKKEQLEIVMNVFRSLKQKVLWKWDLTEMENLPPNVKLSQWLPQQDILAHPNIRLFITHGGLLSTQESTYFGVPVVGMPIFADQHNNVAKIAMEGWGVKVDWDTLEENEFRRAILDSLENERLQQIVSHRSKLMKDLPMSPSEEVTYWVEYVIRHKGAKHLQTPLTQMAWYQIYNTDVWITLLLATASIIFLVIYLVKLFYNCFCCRPTQRKMKMQ